MIIFEDFGLCVLVNGDFTEWFELGRVVRQGDFIVFFFFVFVEDFLIWRINCNLKIKGIRDFYGEEIKLSVFADDNFIMTAADEEILEEVQLEVYGYGVFSGLIINWKKSVIFLFNFVGNISVCISYMRILGSDEKYRYLGVFLMLGEENDAIRVEIINRFIKRVADL